MTCDQLASARTVQLINAFGQIKQTFPFLAFKHDTIAKCISRYNCDLTMQAFSLECMSLFVILGSSEVTAGPSAWCASASPSPLSFLCLTTCWKFFSTGFAEYERLISLAVTLPPAPGCSPTHICAKVGTTMTQGPQ